MSQYANEGPEQGTQPVSGTAEQGDAGAGDAETQADATGGDTQAAQDDGGTADASADYETTDGSSDADAEVPEEERPVWNVQTHGTLDENDPRRKQYRVINE